MTGSYSTRQHLAKIRVTNDVVTHLQIYSQLLHQFTYLLPFSFDSSCLFLFSSFFPSLLLFLLLFFFFLFFSLSLLFLLFFLFNFFKLFILFFYFSASHLLLLLNFFVFFFFSSPSCSFFPLTELQLMKYHLLIIIITQLFIYLTKLTYPCIKIMIDCNDKS